MELFHRGTPPEKPKAAQTPAPKPLLTSIVDFIRGRSDMPDAKPTTADLGYGFHMALVQHPIINAADPARYTPLVMPIGINDLGGRIPLAYVSGDGNFPVLPGNKHAMIQQGVGVVDSRGARFVGALPDPTKT